MFSNFKKIIFFVFIIIAIYADDNNSSNKKFYNQGYEINKHNLMQAYNKSARVNLPGRYDLFVEGHFIWWQPKEKGLDLATINCESHNNNFYKIENFKADYTTGFKAAVGGHHYFDDWTFLLSYTRLKKDSKNTLKKINSFYSEWLKNETNEIFAKWNLNFNIFEIELSRKNLTGKNVIFSPNFTINGGWIDQDYNIFSISDNSYASSKSWLIGPKIGIKTFWNTKSSFYIISNISGSLFYQEFSKIKYEDISAVNSTYNQRISNKAKQLTSNINICSGLSYEKCFTKSAALTFQVLYEFLLFSNQNQMRSLLNELKSIKFDAGNLILHGISASLRWDF